MFRSGALATNAAAAALVAVLFGSACDKATPTPTPAVAGPKARRAVGPAGSGSAAQPSGTAIKHYALGDAKRGRAVAAQFECHRCHDGTDLEPIKATSHCVQCHRDVLDDKFKHKPDNARWKKNVAHLKAVPNLAAIAKRQRTDWIVSFILEPRDLRPHLLPTMPRLPIDEAKARDLAAYLVSLAGDDAAPAVSLAGADIAAGRKVIEEKGCGACHMFTGVPALPEQPKVLPDRHETREAIMLAPDLRFARMQLDAAHLIRWLKNPAAVKPNTKMPQAPMTDDELKNLAHYILHVPLQPISRPAIPERLAVLKRKVTFKEVNEKVFAVTCRHCHSDPNVALGDGGPGNTGGFGFKPRKLNLTEYRMVNAGYVDDAGERQSVFAKLDGTPRLVAALLARQAEEHGVPNAKVRGMPLGLPALTPKQIQLVDTWVAQGRPQ